MQVFFFNLLSFPPWPYDAFLTVINGISVCILDLTWRFDCCVEFWGRMPTLFNPVFL